MIGSLDWVHLAWPMMVAVCLALAYVHLGLWLRLRDRWAHLMLAGAAAAVAAIGGFELAFMDAATPEQANRLLRWVQLPSFFLTLCLAGFARHYFGSLRGWLFACVLLARATLLGLAFASPAGAYYRHADTLKQIVLPGGARVSVLTGVASPWSAFAAATWLLLAVLIADSARQAWLRSPPDARARIARIALSLFAFIAFSAVYSFLVRVCGLQSPYLTTPAFSLALLTLASDLTADLARASRLAESLRASQADLRESEVERDLAVDAASLALWSLEASSFRLRGSTRFREMFGLVAEPPYRFAEVLEWVHPEDQARAHTELETAISSLRPLDTELRVRSAQGGWRWVRFSGHLDDTPAGAGLRLRGACYEVTELRLAEERFRKIVQSVPSALLIVEADSRIVFANQHAVDLFGYSVEELAGLKFERLVPEWLRERRGRQRSRQVEKPRARTMGLGLELFGRRKDGGEFPVELALAPLPADNGDLLVTIVTDITERHEQELASARQRAELTHLSRVAVLGELSASMAHELNQPLAAILSNAQAAQRFLGRDPVDLRELREIIDDIVADDKRAGEVIRRLRAMVRKEELPRAPLDLNDVVRGVLRIAHSELVSRGVAVESELGEDLPAIDGDSVQLQQVMLNLIVNACDAMAEQPNPRKLIVRTRSEDHSVRIEIVDRGTGIAELERIFEPFVTTKSHGTGLGLSVCTTIVGSHGGRIWASNNTDGGATLTVSLPSANGPLA